MRAGVGGSLCLIRQRAPSCRQAEIAQAEIGRRRGFGPLNGFAREPPVLLRLLERWHIEMNRHGTLRTPSATKRLNACLQELFLDALGLGPARSPPPKVFAGEGGKAVGPPMVFDSDA